MARGVFRKRRERGSTKPIGRTQINWLKSAVWEHGKHLAIFGLATKVTQDKDSGDLAGARKHSAATGGANVLDT